MSEAEVERARWVIELAELAAERREILAMHRRAVVAAVRAGVKIRTVSRISGVSRATVAKWAEQG